MQELITAGVIKKEEGINHPNRNVITRAVGAPQSLDVDNFILPLEDDDYVLLCSDGLHGMLSDEEILQLVTDDTKNLEEKTDLLIDRAKKKGGKDNIAVILIQKESRGEIQC